MKIGIIGSGALGRSIALFLKCENIPELHLECLHGIDETQATRVANELGIQAVSLGEVLQRSNMIVEATTAVAMPAIVREAVTLGKHVLAMSVGGFALDPDLFEYIAQSPGSVSVPSGGVTGMDGLLALREIGLDSVVLSTTKAPRSLAGAPFFSSGGPINDPMQLTEPMLIFDGTARQAIKYFPANANLAITISLAGLGFDRTRVKIIADPAATKTTQHLEAVAGECVMETTVRGIPLPENPRTAMVALQSIKALLRKTAARVHIGT